jgi:hypothetical protein
MFGMTVKASAQRCHSNLNLSRNKMALANETAPTETISGPWHRVRGVSAFSLWTFCSIHSGCAPPSPDHRRLHLLRRHISTATSAEPKMKLLPATLAVALTSLISSSQALYFYLDGTTPKCFYEDLAKGTLVVGKLRNLWHSSRRIRPSSRPGNAPRGLRYIAICLDILLLTHY